MVSEQIEPCLWGTSQWFALFYQPDWLVTFFTFQCQVIILLGLPFPVFEHSFLLSPFLDHACSLYLPWGLLLGRYLKGITFKCNPSDYTKTEYGFWANPTMPMRNPANDLPFFYQPDWCVYLHFPMPTLLWCYYCPFLSPGTAFFCPCFFFVHACSLYLLWGLLLGRYLKGMTFKLNPSDYTKTEYGFWANPTMPWGTHPMICHFSFINLTDVVTFSLFNANIIIVFGLPFPVSWHSFLQYPFLDLICTLCLPWGLLLGWYLKGLAFKCIPPLIIPILNMVSEQNCLYYNFSYSLWKILMAIKSKFVFFFV